MERLVRGVEAIARKNKARLVVFDMPPFRPDVKARVLPGSFMILNYLRRFMVVSNYDPSSIHGVVNLISAEYPFIRPRLSAFLVNMVPPDRMEGEEAMRMKSYVEKLLGITPDFIRYDRTWESVYYGIIPILIQDPAKGAFRDLLTSLVLRGLVDPETLREKLNLKVKFR